MEQISSGWGSTKRMFGAGMRKAEHATRAATQSTKHAVRHDLNPVQLRTKFNSLGEAPAAFAADSVELQPAPADIREHYHAVVANAVRVRTRAADETVGNGRSALDAIKKWSSKAKGEAPELTRAKGVIYKNAAAHDSHAAQLAYDARTLDTKIERLVHDGHATSEELDQIVARRLAHYEPAVIGGAVPEQLHETVRALRSRELDRLATAKRIATAKTAFKSSIARVLAEADGDLRVPVLLLQVLKHAEYDPKSRATMIRSLADAAAKMIDTAERRIATLERFATLGLRPGAFDFERRSATSIVDHLEQAVALPERAAAARAALDRGGLNLSAEHAHTAPVVDEHDFARVHPDDVPVVAAAVRQLRGRLDATPRPVAENLASVQADAPVV